jgi:nicotinamidase-related amidase
MKLLERTEMTDADIERRRFLRAGLAVGAIPALAGWSRAANASSNGQSAPEKEAEALRARGFTPLRMGFGERPALVVIDVIRAFTDSSLPLGSNLDNQITAIARLMTVAHQRKVPVIMATIAYDDADLKSLTVWSLKHKGGVATLREASKNSGFDPRLPLRGTETVLRKNYASCFFGTDLVPRLVAYDVDTLLITGCSTSGCVRATAVDAMQNGFRPMVVRDAVGDRRKAAHEQSLADIDAIYGDVVSLNETLEYLAGLPTAPA